MSSKRTRGDEKAERRKKGDEGEDQTENLQFEDAYEDEIEEEEEQEHDGTGTGDGDQAMEEDDEDDQGQEQEGRKQLYLPWVDGVEQNEQMEYDNSAYTILHQMQVEFPFLSFDFIRDNMGELRTKFPQTAYMVAGTQADDHSKHKITVMKMSDLHRTKKDRLEDESSDEDEDDSDVDDLDEDATLDFRHIKHTGAVNRIRSMPQSPNIVASWSDAGRVYMWDLSKQLGSMGAIAQTVGIDYSDSSNTLPTFAFKGHKDEGYAMDWSPVKGGRLATGDCKKFIYVWQVTPAGQCLVDETPFSAHTKSVEDLQWSPTEESVLASCSVDLSIRIWDMREKKKSMICIDSSHKEDVNVIAWNRKVPFLLASGSDDGAIKVWDLRMLQKNQSNPLPVGHYTWHRDSITSLEWHPYDDTVLAAAGSDNQVSVWDFGLEEDPEQVSLGPGLQSDIIGSSGEKVTIPPQLLFLHQGQKDVKEIHFHPQISGMIGSTAADGFHIFVPEPLDPKGAAKYLDQAKKHR